MKKWPIYRSVYNILHFGSHCLVRCTSGRASFPRALKLLCGGARTEVSEAGDSEFKRIIRFCAICYTQIIVNLTCHYFELHGSKLKRQFDQSHEI